MDRPSDRQRLHVRVHGRVQGVGYRQFVLRAAVELGLRGYVRNESSGGSVEVLAEGRVAVLQVFLERLKSGPPLSRVDSIRTTWGTPSGTFAEFQIRS